MIFRIYFTVSPSKSVHFQIVRAEDQEAAERKFRNAWKWMDAEIVQVETLPNEG